MLKGPFTRPVSTWWNGGSGLTNEMFNIRWRYIAKKELSANMHCNRKVCFISILSVGFPDDYG